MIDPSKLLVVVTSHGDFPKTHENHLPLWTSHGATVLTYFPEETTSPPTPARRATKTEPGTDARESQASYDAYPAIAHGKAAKHEPLSTERFLWLLKHLNDKTEAQYFVLFNQGSFSLEPMLEDKWFQDEYLIAAFPPMSNDPMDKQPIPLASYPLIFSRAILGAMITGIEGLREKATDNFPTELKVWNLALNKLAKKQTIKFGQLLKKAFVVPQLTTDLEIKAISAIRESATIITGMSGENVWIRDNRLVRMLQSAYADKKSGVSERYQPKEKFVTKLAPQAPGAQPALTVQQVQPFGRVQQPMTQPMQPAGR